MICSRDEILYRGVQLTKVKPRFCYEQLCIILLLYTEILYTHNSIVIIFLSPDIVHLLYIGFPDTVSGSELLIVIIYCTVKSLCLMSSTFVRVFKNYIKDQLVIWGRFFAIVLYVSTKLLSLSTLLINWRKSWHNS